MNYFQSSYRFNIAHIFLNDVQPRRSSPLPPLIVRAPKQQQNREIQTMRMISEKAVAFFLALAMSGTAFNTFIV